MGIDRAQGRLTFPANFMLVGARHLWYDGIMILVFPHRALLVEVSVARTAAHGDALVLPGTNRRDSGPICISPAVRQMQLRARAYHRIRKLARTIADLAGEPRTLALHHVRRSASLPCRPGQGVRTAKIAGPIHLRPAAAAGVGPGQRRYIHYL